MKRRRWRRRFDTLSYRQRFVLLGTDTIEKDYEIIAGILDGTTDFGNRVYRESIENKLDPVTIDLPVNAREVAEANWYDATNPRR